MAAAAAASVPFVQTSFNSLLPLSPPLHSLGPGTRPGPGGAPLISTGVSGIDSALGGGLPLGRLLLVESSCPSGAPSAADALARLFVAEGVACGQRVAWVQSRSQGDDLEERQRWWVPGRAIPRSERGRAGSSIEGAAAPVALAAAAPRGGDSRGEEGVDEEDDEGSDLKIAWQYRRYIASARASREEEERKREEEARAERRRRRLEEEESRRSSSHSSSSISSSPTTATAVKAWCHDFDLTRRTLCPGFGEGGSEAFSPFPSPSPSSPRSSKRMTLLVAAGSLSAAADAAVAAARASTAHGSLPPARILVSDPGSPEWEPATKATADGGRKDDDGAPPPSPSSFSSVPLLLRRLRGALRGARAAAVVTVRAGALSAAELAAARACADAVISLSPLRGAALNANASRGGSSSDPASLLALELSPSLIAGADKNGSAVALARVVRLPPPGPAVPSRPQPCSGFGLKSTAEKTSGVLLVVSRRRGSLSVAPAAIDHDAEEAAEANGGRGASKGASAACGARPGSRSAAALEF